MSDLHLKVHVLVRFTNLSAWTVRSVLYLWTFRLGFSLKVKCSYWRIYFQHFVYVV